MSEEITPQEITRRTRRSFLTWLVASGAGLGAWAWMRTRLNEAGLQWPFRRALEANSKLWRGYYDPNRLGAAPVPAPGEKFRVNGDVGLDDEIEDENWQIKVADRQISLDDLKALPRTETSCMFKCIEGWSQPVAYAGVSFVDFMKHYRLGTRSGQVPDWEKGRDDLYDYVGLESADGEYYVSIDMASVWHPRTVLAWEINGKPLAEGNGAPLRLMIPVKYGIKNLKRVGRIFFSDQRPRDYWHERGYDWYAGL